MSTVRSRRLFALLVASAVVLTSCGGSDSDSTSSGNRQRNAALTTRVRQVRTQVRYFDRYDHTNIALSNEDELIVWGSKAFSRDLLDPPVSRARVAAISNTQAVAIGLDNTFHAWGSNPDSINMPPADLDLSTVSSLSLDDGVVMAIDENGKLWAWGSIWRLQGATIPNEVRDAKIVKAVSGNAQFQAALDDTGTVHVWGSWSKVPEVKEAMSGIKAKSITMRSFTLSVVTTDGKIVEAGYSPDGSGLFAEVEVDRYARDWWGASLAVDTDGRLHFQQGMIEVPKLVAQIDKYNLYVESGSPKAVSIDATNAYFTVLFDDGSFWNFTQFYLDGMEDPEYFFSSNMVSPVAAGNYKSFAVSDDYTITNFHTLSEGDTAPPTDDDFLAVAAGWNHVLGLRKNGSVVSWGEGPGNNEIPEGLSPARQIGAGYGFSAVRDIYGQISTWGTFQSSTAWEHPPVDYHFYEKMSTGFHNVIAIGTNYQTDQRVVEAGGDNSYGQADVPADLDANQVQDVAIGYDCAAAVMYDGSVKVWGQCEGNEKNIPAGAQFYDIEMGAGLIAGITYDSELVAWGDNVSVLGERPSNIRNISALSVGTGHILAVDDEGGVFAWGPGVWGETNIPDSFKPLPVPDRYDENYDDNLPDEGENVDAQVDGTREPIPTPTIIDDTPVAVFRDGGLVTVTPTLPTPPAVEPVNESTALTMKALPTAQNPATTVGKVVTIAAAVKLLGLKKVTKTAFIVPTKVSASSASVCSITKSAVTINGAGICDVKVSYTDSKKKKRTKSLALVGTP